MVVVCSFQLPDTPIIFEHQSTRAIFDKRDLGIGTVYISEKTLCWTDDNGRGFTLSYNHITMHAKSSDLSIHPTPCVYIMIDTHVPLPGEELVEAESDQNQDEDNDEIESVSEAEISELIFVTNSENLDQLYEAIKQCQALNPDPVDVEDDDMYEDAEDTECDVIGGGDAEMEQLSNRFRNNSMNLNHCIRNNGNGDHNNEEDQFEDAD